MVGARTITAIAGLLLGLLVSVAAWVVADTLLLFLFLPFVPFLFGSRSSGTDDSDGDSGGPVRSCPRCGFRTTDPEFDYCPRDGRRLRE